MDRQKLPDDRSNNNENEEEGKKEQKYYYYYYQQKSRGWGNHGNKEPVIHKSTYSQRIWRLKNEKWKIWRTTERWMDGWTKEGKKELNSLNVLIVKDIVPCTEYRVLASWIHIAQVYYNSCDSNILLALCQAIRLDLYVFISIALCGARKIHIHMGMLSTSLSYVELLFVWLLLTSVCVHSGWLNVHIQRDVVVHLIFRCANTRCIYLFSVRMKVQNAITNRTSRYIWGEGRGIIIIIISFYGCECMWQFNIDLFGEGCFGTCILNSSFCSYFLLFSCKFFQFDWLLYAVDIWKNNTSIWKLSVYQSV